MVLETIAEPAGAGKPAAAAADVRALERRIADPLADHDLQLSLSLCYELHYTSFRHVDAAWEWDPGLLAFRSELERLFMSSLRREAGEPAGDVPPEEIGGRLLLMKPDRSVGRMNEHLSREADMSQVLEFLIHRSPVRLRRPDTYGWTIARLRGAPRRTLARLFEVTVPARTLYSRSMRALGLDDRDGAYLDLLPGSTLAEMNLLSYFGLHRRARGAMLGQIAMLEILQPPEERACERALRRLGADDESRIGFAAAKSETDEPAPAPSLEMAEDMARSNPDLGRDIILGAKAVLAVQGRLLRRVLDRWRRGASSLLPEQRP
jgi:hypothetical protein